MLGQRDQGWSEADRAADRVVRRFGAGTVRPASLLS
jgi:DNA polymerase-4